MDRPDFLDFSKKKNGSAIVINQYTYARSRTHLIFVVLGHKIREFGKESSVPSSRSLIVGMN